MAGGKKGSSAANDLNKKRKREASDAQTKSKRHRKETKGAGVNGKSQESNESALINGATSIQSLLPVDENEAEGGWRVSKPMGGRMLDIDPILTADEQ